MHSMDSYHCTIPAFGMEIPPRQPGTWVGCGCVGCSPRPPTQGQSVLHVPALCTSTEAKPPRGPHTDVPERTRPVALTAAKHIVKLLLCLKMKVSEVEGRCWVFPRSQYKTTAQSWIKIPSLPQLKPDLRFLSCEMKKGKHTVAKKLEKEKSVTF